MAQNIHRVGDYVYFETFPSAPYQIRRIEELNMKAAGAVEAKVTCFFRRRDLPNSLLKIADQAERQNKILSKPRKTLLSAKESSNSATNGGDLEPKENGIDSVSAAAAADRNSSTEPDETKKEDESASNSKRGICHQSRCYGFAGLPSGAELLSVEQLHELRQRELFLSRIVETLPATQIRGKCTVAILNEVESSDMYLGQEDSFFYSLVYDPANQTLLADKGRIEIGDRHQATIPDLQQDKGKEKEGEDVESSGKMEDAEMKEQQEGETSSSANAEEQRSIQVTDRERVVYHPYHKLRDLEIDQFLMVARAVGTFSRALDSSSSIKLPTLHQTASAASRDITLLHAMALLHQANYDLGQATKFLVPPPDKHHYPLETDNVTSHNTSNLGGPILCRDQLEEWSAAESTLFEDAIEKYGKDFHDIRLDCLPWKSMRDIVEYYYMWKTTSRYAELQKAKRSEQANKLKQIYIPNKSNVNLVDGPAAAKNMIPCESCEGTEAAQWYFWGPAQQLRLCGECHVIWKKRGGLKKPHELETYDLDGGIDGRIGGVGGASQNRFGAGGRNGMPQAIGKPTAGQILIGQKGRVAFYLNSPLETRVARRMAPKQVFNIRKAARSPFFEFDLKAIQDYYFGRPIVDVLNMARQVKRGVISQWAINHLSMLHKKRAASSGGAGPAATSAAADSAAAAGKQQNGGKN